MEILQELTNRLETYPLILTVDNGKILNIKYSKIFKIIYVIRLFLYVRTLTSYDHLHFLVAK